MSLPWSMVCLAGLWGFVVCAIGLTLQGFPARGVLAAKPCLRWGTALLICFILWLAGMANT